jgi:hypothetical protein
VQIAERGWNDPVNLTCTCARYGDGHAPQCPLSSMLDSHPAPGFRFNAVHPLP